MLIENELVTKEFIDNGGPTLVLLKVIDSFGATGIIQFPYFKNNNFHLDALYVKTSSDDRNGVAIRYFLESCSDPLYNEFGDNVSARYFLIPGGIDPNSN